MNRLPFAKPEPRRRVKARADRREGEVIKAVRAEVADRDYYCRLYRLDDGLRGLLREMFGACRGRSEWSHYNLSHRRAKTVGRPPEQRHDRRYSLMLCDFHAAEYDENRMHIEATTDRGCDGPLRFERGGRAWTEQS